MNFSKFRYAAFSVLRILYFHQPQFLQNFRGRQRGRSRKVQGKVRQNPFHIASGKGELFRIENRDEIGPYGRFQKQIIDFREV
jgi:hypothetical protein